MKYVVLFRCIIDRRSCNSGYYVCPSSRVSEEFPNMANIFNALIIGMEDIGLLMEFVTLRFDETKSALNKGHNTLRKTKELEFCALSAQSISVTQYSGDAQFAER